ncbi:hypothetical protein BLD25_00295 [Candidatus Gracilibacteria bacterium GN02-872]|nr:hypothetical protein BLD25_00295 [Candidatus Gracilibacteria bacterium GN02-872]
MKRKITLGIIIGLFSIGIIFVLISYFYGIDLKELFVKGNISIEEKVGLIALLYIFRNYLLIPSTVLILITGFILQNFILTLVVSTIGVGVGILQTYFVGSNLSGELENKKYSKTIKSYQEKIKQNGFKVIFFASLVPIIPVDLVYYAAALSKYDVKKFFLAGILGEFPLIVLYSYLGKEADKYTKYIIIFFVTLGIFYFSYLYRKEKRKKGF